MKVSGNALTEDVTMMNCIIYNIASVPTGDGTNDGVVYFANTKNIKLLDNVVTGDCLSPRVFRFKVVENIEFTGNVFADSYSYTGAGGDLLRVDDGGALEGDALFANNIFQNATQVALHTRPLENVNYYAVNNYFYNCDGGFWLRNFTGEVNFVIAHNYFKDGGQGWDNIGSNAGYTSLYVAYNYFDVTNGSGCYGIFSGGNAVATNNIFAKGVSIKLNGAVVAAEDASVLADAKAVAFIGNSEFDAWALGGVEDLYYTSFEAATADEALAADTKLVLLNGGFSGVLEKQLDVTSILEGIAVADKEGLYASPYAPTIDAELVFKDVATSKLSYVAIKGFGQVYTFGAKGTKAVFDNLYAHDSTFTPEVYAANGITNSGANNTNTKMAVIQIQAASQWNSKASITNSVFKDLNAGAIWFMALSSGADILNCKFENVAYDAITARYSGGAGGPFTVDNCTFDHIGYNGVYIRSATGSWSGALTLNVTNCSFNDCVYDGANVDSSFNFGAIATRGYGEKYSVDVNIVRCDFGLNGGYINLRDNVTNVETWRPKGVHYDVVVKYCTFQVAAAETNISRSFGGGDDSTTNAGDMLYDCNYIYTLDGEGAATVVIAKYDDILEESNATVYESKEELLAGYKASLVKALADDYMADFNTKNGTTLEASQLDTADTESSYMVAMLTDETLMAKWTKLYAALATVAGEESMDPASITAENADSVKGLYLANLNGFFNVCQHTDTYLSKTSADFSDLANIKAVLALAK